MYVQDRIAAARRKHLEHGKPFHRLDRCGPIWKRVSWKLTRRGRALKEGGYDFDLCYTSVLKRAIRTLWIALDEMDRMYLPVINSWRLNERHYGALQGLNKAEMAAKFGEEQVHIWRRSYDIRPPALEKTDERYPGKDPRYAGLTGCRAANLRMPEGYRGTLPALLA